MRPRFPPRSAARRQLGRFLLQSARKACGKLRTLVVQALVLSAWGRWSAGEKRGLLELCPAQGSALDLRTYQAQARHVGSQRS